MKIKFWKNTKEDNNVNVKDVTGTPTIITSLKAISLIPRLSPQEVRKRTFSLPSLPLAML